MKDHDLEANEPFDYLGDCIAGAVGMLERLGIALPLYSYRGASPLERARHIFDAAFDAVDRVRDYLKLKDRNEANFAVDVLTMVVIVLSRMEEALVGRFPERLVQFANALGGLRRLVAAGPSRQSASAGRPNLEQQDRKTIYRWLKLVTVNNMSESDAWDEVKLAIPGAIQATRERLQARAQMFISRSAPSSNQRRPVGKNRALALRYARLAIAEDQLGRVGVEVPASAPNPI